MANRISIIPGFTHKPTDKCYRWLAAFLKKNGFDVRLIEINWKRGVMTDYVKQFKQQYEKDLSDKNYVLGFSFGAMIAFIAAQDITPDKLFLCSLSPYFREDLSTVSSSSRRVIGKRRMIDFQKYSANKIAKNFNTPTVIICGGKEGSRYPSLLKRCSSTAQRLKNGKLVIADGAPHEIDHPTYRESIVRQFISE